MNRRGMTLVPILLGGTAGAIFGLFEAFPKTAPEAAPKSADTRASAAPSSASRVTPSVGAALGQALPATTVPVGSAVTTAEAAASPSAAPVAQAPGASASAASAPPTRRAFDLAEPTTQEALLAAQVACNRTSPEDCERAAFALESGTLGVKDPTRARALRRIALTVYVKQCETGRVLACARLAEMYDVGDIVQSNPRNAQALRDRVKELCAKRPSEAGCSP